MGFGPKQYVAEKEKENLLRKEINKGKKRRIFIGKRTHPAPHQRPKTLQEEDLPGVGHLTVQQLINQ